MVIKMTNSIFFKKFRIK